jgi:acyl-CoA dehydrogenase
MFTLVVYGQLILENARIYNLEESLVDQIFDFMVRDFSGFALTLYGKPSTSDTQMGYLLKMIKKPAVDNVRFGKVWNEQVLALKDLYEMKP